MEFESDFDERRRNLSNFIVQSQKNFVVTEVRKLITSARTSFEKEDYESANADLHSARELWHSVISESNPEIEYWLEIAQEALDISEKEKDLF